MDSLDSLDSLIGPVGSLPLLSIGQIIWSPTFKFKGEAWNV